MDKLFMNIMIESCKMLA